MKCRFFGSQLGYTKAGYTSLARFEDGPRFGRAKSQRPRYVLLVAGVRIRVKEVQE